MRCKKQIIRIGRCKNTLLNHALVQEPEVLDMYCHVFNLATYLWISLLFKTAPAITFQGNIHWQKNTVSGILWWSLLWPPPHYAGEITKRSFILKVRPTVHTNPSRKQTLIFENAPQPKEFKNAGFAFCVNGNIIPSFSNPKHSISIIMWHHP